MYGHEICRVCDLDHNSFDCPRCESIDRTLQKAFGQDKMLVFKAWLEGVVGVEIRKQLKRFKASQKEQM